MCIFCIQTTIFCDTKENDKNSCRSIKISFGEIPLWSRVLNLMLILLLLDGISVPATSNIKHNQMIITKYTISLGTIV